MSADAKEWPVTVDEAVGVLLRLLPEKEQSRIAEMNRDELHLLHVGLGVWVRNTFGLWEGNDDLLESTRQANADDASMVIIEALWLRLREGVPKLQ